MFCLFADGIRLHVFESCDKAMHVRAAQAAPKIRAAGAGTSERVGGTCPGNMRARRCAWLYVSQKNCDREKT